MDDDHRVLLQRPFVVVTEFVESAHDVATKGQSGRQSAEDHVDAARKLHGAKGIQTFDPLSWRRQIPSIS